MYSSKPMSPIKRHAELYYHHLVWFSLLALSSRKTIFFWRYYDVVVVCVCYGHARRIAKVDSSKECGERLI